jgi:uridine kinase
MLNKAQVILKKVFIAHCNKNMFISLVVIAVVIKLILMGLFSSDYQNKMFMPFVEAFITNLFSRDSNVYQFWYISGFNLSFPYPPVMLFIETIPGLALHFFSSIPLFFRNIVFKLPNLFFDLMAFYYLIKLFPTIRNYLLFLYFFSPIILYSTYMHGQLDIIPTSLLMGAIYFAVSGNYRNKHLKSLTMLICSVLCKLHVLIVVPLFFLYLLKKKSFLEAIISIFFCVFIVSICMYPFWGDGFINTVLTNVEYNVMFQLKFLVNTRIIYIPFFLIVLLYLYMLSNNTVNKDLFVVYCGILFFALLVSTKTMPGWYVWIVPFAPMIFLFNNNYIYKFNIGAYAIFNFLYCVYFIFFHKTKNIDLFFLSTNLNFLKLDNEQIASGIVYTIMTSLMIYFLFFLYKFGISSNTFYQRKDLPFCLGIAGDSGVGKTTLSQIFRITFGHNNVLVLEGDGYHKWGRGEEMWNIFTHFDPRANFLYKQARDIEDLKKGLNVSIKEYDHKNGTFRQEKEISPRKYIVLVGLHSLYLPQIRKNLDLKIYVDAEENLKRFWKVKRDMLHRGYDRTTILKQINSRIKDSKKYIFVQKDIADLCIKYFDKGLKEDFNVDYNPRISVELTFNSDVNIGTLIDILVEKNINVEYEYLGINKQKICMDHSFLEGREIDFYSRIKDIIPHFDELEIENMKFTSNISGIVMVIIVLMISSKMHKESEYFV